MPATWIEAAINGPWGKERQPGSPTTVDECIEQGVACDEAGAVPWMVSGLGVDVTPLVSEAVERGGHVRSAIASQPR